MSRSRKSNPVDSIVIADSEKQDKRRANRKFRRVNRRLLRECGEDGLKLLYEVASNWDWAKDGSRSWHSPYVYGDEDWFKKLLRK